MRRFELVEGGASKFWEIETKAEKVVVRFGRIGTTGQTQEKTFADAAAANAELAKLVRDKTRKGYRPAVSDGDETAEQPEAEAPKLQAPQTTQSTEAGWLDAGTGYRLSLDRQQIRCKNAKGQLLSAVPKAVKETAAYEQIDNLREFLAAHERECAEVVESWMLRSLPVPQRVLMAVWEDPAWRRALENAVVVPAAAPNEGGFFRGVDAKRGVGVVDREGETVWLNVDSVAIPHPIALSELDDLRGLATELALSQGIPQLFREVFVKEVLYDANATAVSSLSGGVFKQLNHALAACKKHGFRVSGGSALTRVWELDARGALKPQEARYWIGSDDPTSEALTGDLVWVDEHERVIPLSRVGAVAFSEGMRMATAIYAGRVVQQEAAHG